MPTCLTAWECSIPTPSKYPAPRPAEVGDTKDVSLLHAQSVPAFLVLWPSYMLGFTCHWHWPLSAGCRGLSQTPQAHAEIGRGR